MVTILNHSPVIEILREGDRVSGVLAVDTSRESPSFTLVRAKTVILATGATHRLYHSGPTPAYMFNTAHCPNDAGGPALALRAGAALVNMEFPYVHAGPKFSNVAAKPHGSAYSAIRTVVRWGRLRRIRTGNMAM